MRIQIYLYIAGYSNNKIVEITIKQNDAFQVLQAITRDRITKVDQHIVNYLIENEFMEGSSDDFGRSLQDVIDDHPETTNKALKNMFGSVEHRSEIKELLNHLIFCNPSADDPCPNCGCELITEHDGFGNAEWVDVECSNTSCDYAFNNEPDWDIQPGGHSFDN